MNATGITVAGKRYPGNPIRSAAEGEARRQVISDGTELLTWLAKHDAPVPAGGIQVSYVPPDGVAGVRRIAAALGVRASSKGPLVQAAVTIGTATYRVWAPKSLVPESEAA